MNDEICMRWEKIDIGFLCAGDEAFRISTGIVPERLLSSIAKVGILHPIWVKSFAEGSVSYLVVLGYSRFDAARSIGIESIPCLVVDETTSDADLFLANIYDNLSSRELNILEQATALKKSEHYLGREKTLTDIMPAIGLKPSPRLLERMLDLLALPAPVQDAISQGDISSTCALFLPRLEENEQLAFLSVVKKLKPGVNVQREFLEYLNECARRGEESILELLEKPPLKEILSDESKPTAECIAHFRAALHRLRYPHLAACEETFNRFIHSLRLPPEVTLEAPAFFEGSEFRLEVRFHSPEDLLQRLKKISDSFSSHEVQKAFISTMP